MEFLGGGQPQPVIEVALPRPAPNLAQACQPLLIHEFAAHVTLGDEGKVGHQVAALGREFLLEDSGIFRTPLQLFQIVNMSVPEQYLKAHADLVNPVVLGFQLAPFINDVLRRGDLAAVMQPGRQPKFPPAVLRAKFKVLKSRGGTIRGSRCEGNTQLGDPLTVSRRVG